MNRDFKSKSLSVPFQVLGVRSKLMVTSGLIWSRQVVLVFGLWYFFSFVTLFSNKYILLNPDNDPTILGCFQLLMCIVGGYFHTKVPIGMITSTTRTVVLGESRFRGRSLSSRLFVVVGCLRFSTLVLGLVALWYAPVSFAETVKSAAPVFTVILSCMILGEECNLLINLSLIPVVLGLVICSAYELSLNVKALTASLAANLSECLQNVFSKKLLTSDRLDPHHLQFLTALSSILIQVPCVLLLVDLKHFWSTVTSDSNLLLSYVLNGICFHCQSLSEYMLLSQISPVTHSVANTTKRALLILLSVKTFGNEVSLQSWIGTGILFFGVFLYNRAKNSVTTVTHSSQEHLTKPQV